MNFNYFGSGAILPVAYDTAWVATIPDPDDPSKPAFMKSLNWLRDHQLSDGSWGAHRPVFAFDRLNSTLIAVICLKQWHYEYDSDRIERGVKAVNYYLKQLKISNNMTVGFELIFPTLVDLAKQYGFEFNDPIIDLFRREKSIKIEKILSHENNCLSFGGPKPWWHSLEALGSIYKNNDIYGMVSSDALICCSYSATAFAMKTNKELADSFMHIKAIVAQNEGGVPPSPALDIFDLSWSIGFLKIADFDLNHPKLESAINHLEYLWSQSNGMVGACLGLPPDADDISNVLFALSATNRLNSVNCLESLMKFFRNDYFLTFESERHPSISTNTNCLIALKYFRSNPRVNAIIAKVYEWLKKMIISENFQFADKWHYSAYYSMSRSVFALEDIDNELTQTLIRMMITKQNKDGGWGMDGMSSHEETAYVSLALTYWTKRHNEYKRQSIECIRKAKHFLDSNTNELNAFWINKTLYCPITIVMTAIFAAKYAIESII